MGEYEEENLKLQNKMYEHKVALEKHTKQPGTHSKLSV